jgi:hypothetical protein
MKRPENFEKIDNTKINVKGQDILIDFDHQFNNRIFVFQSGGTNLWSNVVMYDFNFSDDTYDIKICLLGDGDNGWYYRKGGLIPYVMFKTIDAFKEFIEITMENVFANTDLVLQEQNDSQTIIQSPHTILHKVVSSDNRTTYDVVNTGNDWTCTCKAFQYSKEAIPTCKHIKQIKK